jgi:hypothetical protein
VALAERHREVELGRLEHDRLLLRGCVAHLPASQARVVRNDHHLEQRMPGRRPGRVEHLDQPLERHVGMGVRGQIGLPDPGQQLGEARVTGDVRAQHQGVDEEPDEAVERRIRPPRRDRPQGKVRASAQPAQQRSQAGLEHHEQGHVVFPGKPDESGVQRRVQPRPDRRAPMGGRCGPRPVEGQRQLLGQPSQGRGPMGELAGQDTVVVPVPAEQVALPHRVVGVLHRQLRPPRRPAGQPGLVRLGEIPDQDSQRPAVTRDVVRDEHQHVLLVVDGEQRCAYGQLPR